MPGNTSPQPAFRTLAAALLLACTLPALSQAPTAPPPTTKSRHVPHRHEAREEISAAEEQWRQAQLSSDTAVMDKLLSEDFLGTLASGETVTKAQMLDRMKSRHLEITQLDLSDVKIKLLGPIAIVTSLAMIQGANNNQPLNGNFRYTHVYQRVPSGAWKITSFSATRVRGPHPPNGPGSPSAPPPPAS